MNRVSKKTYQLICVIIALTSILANNVIGQSVNNVLDTSVFKINVTHDIKPSIELKGKLLENNKNQPHTYYHSEKTQIFNSDSQMKIKLRETHESVIINQTSPRNNQVINDKSKISGSGEIRIEHIKSRNVNTQISPSIRGKKSTTAKNVNRMENNNSNPVSRKINEK